MKYYVIGIAGEKNSGKDTVASMLNYIKGVGLTKANYADWIQNRELYGEKYAKRIVHFADPLKKVISIIYNIPIESLYDRKHKDDYWYSITYNRFLNCIINKNNYKFITIEDLTKNNLNTILSENKDIECCIKLRTLLQYIGTNICRNNLNDKIWINCAIDNIMSKVFMYGICIVPDVRFKDEFNAIKNITDLNDKFSLYGEVITIKRNNTNQSEHASKNIDFNSKHVIDNNGNLMNLFYKVLDIWKKIK